jgi:hypothetical protein
LRTATHEPLFVNGGNFRMADEQPQGPWPSIEEQLRESRVKPGTALEDLIRQNQDFSMLRPEEARDLLRIPLWLRVHFRKNHPELEFKPGDPTGGYPLALRDIYVWMIEHQDLKPEEGEQRPGGGRAR